MSRIDDLIDELCPDGVEFKALGEVGDVRPRQWAAEGRPRRVGDARASTTARSTRRTASWTPTTMSFVDAERRSTASRRRAW